MLKLDNCTFLCVVNYNNATIIVEQRYTDERLRDRSGTESRVSKQGEERAVVLRYTGEGIAYSPRNKCGAGPTKVDYCIRLTAPKTKTPSHHHRLFYQQWQ
jgi:hypothetical protein